MTNGRVCKKHIESPVIIYKQCVGCELEHLQQQLADRDKTIADLLESERKMREHEEYWQGWCANRIRSLEQQNAELAAEIERLRCKKSAKP